MTFEEKITWVSAAVFAVVPACVLRGSCSASWAQMPATEIAYQAPL